MALATTGLAAFVDEVELASICTSNFLRSSRSSVEPCFPILHPLFTMFLEFTMRHFSL